MISLYQMFRLIFGLVISAFILFAIIYFLGAYTGLSESSQKAEITSNFLKTSGDVYSTGNSVSFTDFAGKDFTITFDATEPGGLVSSAGKTPLHFPLFPRIGGEVLIYSGSLDMGWWEFRFVEALPRTRVLFNPAVQDWDLISGIVGFLPDSEFFEPAITFGFCDGQSVQERLCGSDFCEKDDFLRGLASPPGPVNPCTADLPPDAILVTVARECASESRGICLTPPDPDGIGTISLRSGETMLYKDPLDIVAAIIGGPGKDIYGNSGKSLHKYKNDAFRKEVALAAAIMANRALLLEEEHTPGSECQAVLADFLDTMRSLEALLLDEGYYVSQETSRNLLALLREAKSEHETLVERGCDY